MATLAKFTMTVVDAAGNVVANPVVTVTNETTSALAALKSDRAGATPLDNPKTFGSDGKIEFHVAGGSYQIEVVAGGFSQTIRYEAIGTAAEHDWDDEEIRGPFKVLAADDTGGQNVNTAQPWFPTAGAVAVAADTTYEFEGELHLSRAAGTTSHTTGILFGGTATLTGIAYLALCKEGDANDLQDVSGFRAVAATELVVKAASTSATEQVLILIKGIVRINAAGTLIPQFKYSTAPGGAPTVKANSYFLMRKLGAGSVAERGTWS